MQIPRVVELYTERVKYLIRELPSYEQIKKFALLSEEFSVESGELTPTQKIKRKYVKEKFADIIENLYVEDQQPFTPTVTISKSGQPA